MDENQIGKEGVDGAIAVHRELGPGVLVSVDEAVFCEEPLWPLRLGEKTTPLRSPRPRMRAIPD
jgi:hypothetical protein